MLLVTPSVPPVLDLPPLNVLNVLTRPKLLLEPLVNVKMTTMLITLEPVSFVALLTTVKNVTLELNVPFVKLVTILKEILVKIVLMDVKFVLELLLVPFVKMDSSSLMESAQILSVKVDVKIVTEMSVYLNVN